MSFEWIDHTADRAVRLRAPNLPGLVEAGIRALSQLLFSDSEGPDVRATALSGEWCVEGVDREDALVRALAEALYAMQTQALIPQRVQVENPAAYVLRVRLEGSRAEGAGCLRHEEIKGITYHGLEIRELDGELETVVILDV